MMTDFSNKEKEEIRYMFRKIYETVINEIRFSLPYVTIRSGFFGYMSPLEFIASQSVVFDEATVTGDECNFLGTTENDERLFEINALKYLSRIKSQGTCQKLLDFILSSDNVKEYCKDLESTENFRRRLTEISESPHKAKLKDVEMFAPIDKMLGDIVEETIRECPVPYEFRQELERSGQHGYKDEYGRYYLPCYLRMKKVGVMAEIGRRIAVREAEQVKGEWHYVYKTEYPTVLNLIRQSRKLPRLYFSFNDYTTERLCRALSSDFTVDNQYNLNSGYYLLPVPNWLYQMFSSKEYCVANGLCNTFNFHYLLNEMQRLYSDFRTKFGIDYIYFDKKNIELLELVSGVREAEKETYPAPVKSLFRDCFSDEMDEYWISRSQIAELLTYSSLTEDEREMIEKVLDGRSKEVTADKTNFSRISRNYINTSELRLMDSFVRKSKTGKGTTLLWE